MKQPNFAAMSPAVAKAIEQMMAEQGDKFSLAKLQGLGATPAKHPVISSLSD